MCDGADTESEAQILDQYTGVIIACLKNRTMTFAEFYFIFGLGLVSSLHCVQMCGILVISYSLPLSKISRMTQVFAHLSYNFGRILTYTMLGTVAGFIGGTIGFVGSLAGIENAAAIIGGCLMIVAGFL